ncbi:CocE/NonD family hydrolase [Magnetospirillum sp. 15-1]|uniref:CocE/NonD family hydrolase n=1 Tax=Magnetospirillum sp. 15-1 TaxID=1979370 RepID=UPI0011413A7B|nr:CocE/NonD family hydrolase [Magnetospirillum sp. 15-1]
MTKKSGGHKVDANQPQQALESGTTPITIYNADQIRLMVPGYKAFGQPVPFGSKTDGVYYDGYPQLVKTDQRGPEFGIKKEKDIMVAMRDGVRIAVDVYRPDAEGEKFPAILAWGIWGKDGQEAVAWNWDKPQPYYDSPFWDGTMEAGNYTYTVPRGFVHVIPEPRGMGNSEGDHFDNMSVHDPKDIHDVIRWIAAQPWCNGKVGMMGPSSYSWAQVSAASADDVPAELVAIHPDECPFWGNHFHGIFDALMYHIEYGRHGNDSTFPAPNTPKAKQPSMLMKMLPKDVLDAWISEALEHPDIKYNTKWYSTLKYPFKSPQIVDQILMSTFHPMPVPTRPENVKLPMYIGTPWGVRLYIWGTFEVFERSSSENKKLILYPPGYPARPYAEYHDEIVRWYEYWGAGIDNGIMDEPPVKMFVMGVNKWRFENEWPLKRTEYTKFFLHPQGGLSAEPVSGNPRPDILTQPSPYLDPTVFSLRYRTAPLDQEMEVTGPVACYIDAAIDTDDTNWMVDLVDVDPDGNRQLLSNGYLKAKFRALDEAKSRPFDPIHPRQNPVPVVPGEVNTYAIALMPTANVFKKGHSIEVIIRNQDDLHSRLGAWGVYMLPFMQTVMHEIHFGNSHILLPLIPAKA